MRPIWGQPLEDIMHSILVVGAGKIGATIADMLKDTGNYAVTVADRSAAALEAVARGGVATLEIDISDAVALQAAMKGHYAVLSAAPYHLTGHIAQAARLAGVHYFDLTEDVATTRMVKELAEDATTAFVPQCGLAPGFIAIVAHDIARRFDSLDAVRLRVGALPQYPSNALSYNLTWSTDGVINEYIERCEAIVDGKLREVPALEEREEFSLDGTRYEAFNTSGGLGTLCETLQGQVRSLNYKTIRYPGHCDLMRVLLNDLQLRHRREVLKDILENAVPATLQDMVIVFVTVTGQRGGRHVQETYARKIYGQVVAGIERTAIQVTTAAGICAMLDLLVQGELPQTGFVRQEEVSLATFLANRFGRVYHGAGSAQEPTTAGNDRLQLHAVA
jgi:saccharopine dehydrogenase-like NADP-dependent oxidoreductase